MYRAPSYWNHMSPVSMPSSLGHKKLTVMAMHTSSDQNPEQLVNFSGCIRCWCISRALVSSEIKSFCLFTYPVNFQLLQSAISEQSVSVEFYTLVSRQKSPIWSRRKAKFLWTTKNWLPRISLYPDSQQRDIRPCVLVT